MGGTILHGCKNREGVSCSVNHGILIVGYNADAWLIRNSWGANWGYDGYAWVSRKYDTKTYNDTDVDQGVFLRPVSRDDHREWREWYSDGQCFSNWMQCSVGCCLSWLLACSFLFESCHFVNASSFRFLG